MDSTDQIVATLNRHQDMLQQILDALAALPTPRKQNAAGKAEKAKIWIVNKLKKTGPMTRGELREFMSKGYRDFLDQSLIELVNEGTLVYKNRPRKNSRSHRTLELYEAVADLLEAEPPGDAVADFFNPPTEFQEDLLEKAERHILEIVKDHGPLRPPKFENPLFPQDPEKQKPIPRLAVFHYAKIEDDDLSADAFEKCIEHGRLTVQGVYPDEECSLTDDGWEFVDRTPDLW